MKEFSITLFQRLKLIDKIILICAVLMSGLSLLTLLGGIGVFGTRQVIVQAFAAICGIFLMFLISILDYDYIISKLKYFIFAFSVFALVVVILFGTGVSDGSSTNRNWIKIPGIPFSIQPSEFVKICFIITFAKHIDILKDKINHIWSVCQLMIHAGIIIGLVVISGDLGSALVYMAIMAAMLLVAGLSIWYFIAAGVMMVVIFPYLWEHLDKYQQDRILVGFNPELDPLDKGYQALQSRKAIAAGGFRGAGMWGGAVYKTLPVAQSDFLFAVLAEKFGFFGAFSYMAFMSTMIVRILYIARKARKDYGAYICVGVSAIFIAQTVENIGMCLGMLPVVGITLPFFSYGGSSMIAMYICLGVVQSIYSHNKKYYFERELS